MPIWLDRFLAELKRNGGQVRLGGQRLDGKCLVFSSRGYDSRVPAGGVRTDSHGFHVGVIVGWIGRFGGRRGRLPIGEARCGPGGVGRVLAPADDCLRQMINPHG